MIARIVGADIIARTVTLQFAAQDFARMPTVVLGKHVDVDLTPVNWTGAFPLLAEYVHRLNASPACIWTEDDDGIYGTQCGQLVDGGIAENRVRFCYHCGGRVEERRAEKEGL